MAMHVTVWDHVWATHAARLEKLDNQRNTDGMKICVEHKICASYNDLASEPDFPPILISPFSSFSQFGTMGDPDLASSSNVHTLTFQILIVKDWERFLIWALQPVFQPVALCYSFLPSFSLLGFKNVQTLYFTGHKRWDIPLFWRISHNMDWRLSPMATTWAWWNKTPKCQGCGSLETRCYNIKQVQ